MNYGNTLKSIRTAELISQKKIAEILNINRTTYKEYELQNTIIPLKHLINFCNYFNTSVDYVLGLSEEVTYKNIKRDLDLEVCGKRLKSFRKEFKLTQIDLAQKINVARSMLSLYESGKYLISTHSLYDICINYRISADYLLGRIDKPKYLE